MLELKSDKSELSRLLEQRENAFRYEEGKPAVAEDDVAELTKQINTLAADIRKLKIKIEETNHTNLIDTPEGKMSIAEAIHLIGDMRSELSALEKLRSKYKDEHYGWREETKKYAFQLPQKELLGQISALEKKKVRMDAFLSSWNWKVKLKD